MPKRLKILVVEDSAIDAELVLRWVKRHGYEPDWERVETEADYVARLQPDVDLILSDYEMPLFNGIRALELLKASGLEIPFILVSGTIGEDLAVKAMKMGASDYLLKDRLARVGSAIEHAIADNAGRRERRQDAESLRLFRSLVNRSNDAFEIVDPLTGRFLDINETGLASLGYTRAEYLALRVWDVDPTVTEAAWHEVAARTRTAGSLVGEGRHRRKDGTTFPVEFNARWVALDRDYFVTVVRDITDRKRNEADLQASEERFRTVVENIQEVFWMADPAFSRLYYISPSYEKLSGRTCASLYLSPRDWFGMIHPDDRERVESAIDILPGDQGSNEIYRIVRPDGTPRWVRARVFPIRQAGGGIQRLVGAAEDITALRTMEEQFQQAQKMEAVGTLAGGIAHDFNNILTGIIGYTEFAKLTLEENSPVAEELDAVLNAAYRAAALVGQILAFSRRQKPERQPLQLRHIVNEALKLLRATIPATIEIEAEVATNAPAVLADATQVHQIVMNLCTNSLHAMRDRPGRLTVTLENLAVSKAMAAAQTGLHDGLYARLSVRDTGHGMDAAILSRIFEPFFTTKGPGEGTGLGLAAVHGIMQSHDGVVTVASEPGRGTTFQLYFPAHFGQVAAEAAAAGDVPRGHGERILFVDDEPPLARLGQKILERLGYVVDARTQASEALAAVRAGPATYDLVISDLTMPGMTGTDLAREIHALRPNLPIILTTGYAATLTPENIRALGIRKLLPKPLALRPLGLLINRVLTGAEPDSGS